MKDQGLVWEVAYELKRHFSTERAARRFYDKTARKQTLKLALIRHRLKDNADRIVDRVMSKLLERTRFAHFWNALPDKDQKKILKAQAKEIREILENIL